MFFPCDDCICFPTFYHKQTTNKKCRSINTCIFQVCVKFVPFHQQKPTIKGRNFTYLEDPGISSPIHPFLWVSLRTSPGSYVVKMNPIALQRLRGKSCRWFPACRDAIRQPETGNGRNTWNISFPTGIVNWEKTHDSSEMKRRKLSVIYICFLRYVTQKVTIPSPKLTVRPRKKALPKRKGSSPNHPFSGATVDGSEISFPTTFWMVLKLCK